MSETSISNENLKKHLEILEKNPMRALRRCRDAFQTSAKAHHEVVYEMIAFIVAFILCLEGSAQARKEFLADEYWIGKPHSPKEKNLTRLAAMYMLGVKQSYGALYVQALQYTKVTEYFLERDIEPEEIPDWLRRTPIYKLLDKLDPPQKVACDDDGPATAPSRVQPKAALADTTVNTREKQDKRDLHGVDDDADEAVGHDADDCDDEGDCSDENDDDNDASGSGSTDNHSDGPNRVGRRDRTASPEGTRTKNAKRYPFKQDRELAVMAEGYQKRFFDDMKPNEEVPVMIRRLPDEDGWAKFEICGLLSPREYRTTRTAD